MISPTFNSFPPNLKLKDNEVHVWKASLDQPESIVQMLEQRLSVDEKQRAGRFYFEKDRRHFIIGRGLLRTILGWYLSIEPIQIRFRYGRNGKPELSDNFGEVTIKFNLSHSDNIAFYGFTRSGRIGVDIERVRAIPDMEQIGARFFSEKENAFFRSLPSSKKAATFYNCWTRKEAFIKAVGDGLTLPLNTFDVTFVPGEPAELTIDVGNLHEGTHWSLHALKPAPGYVGAIAVEGHGRLLKYLAVGRE
jgi:4'-phosphopantetheinyl transferase